MCALDRDRYPVVIVGASYAGLAAAAQLGDRALLIDQHAVGAIQRSACAMPLNVAERFDVCDSVLQTYSSAIIHTPYGKSTFPLSSPYCIFDHYRLCSSLYDRSGSDFLHARVNGVDGNVVHTSKGDIYGDVLIDASGWSGALVTAIRPETRQPSRVSIGIEADIPGRGEGIHFYADSRYAPGGYAWVFPAGDTLRIGVLSYRPQSNLKPTLEHFLTSLGYEGKPCRGGSIPWFTRPPVVENVMVAGDAAGHCLPATAEGIRFAMQHGEIAGEIARQISDGEISLADGLSRYQKSSQRQRRHVMALRPLQEIIRFGFDRYTHGWLRLLSTRPFSRHLIRLYNSFGDFSDVQPQSPVIEPRVRMTSGNDGD